MATEMASSTPTVSPPAVTLPAMPAAQVASQAPAPRQEEAPKPSAVKADSKELEQAVKYVAQIVRRNLNFSIDKETGIVVVKVIDASSKEVVRQIPAEEMLALARRMAELSQAKSVSGEDAKGLLMSTRV